MEQLNSYALFDAARAQEANLRRAMEWNKEGRSLYRGRSEEKLAAYAPYLFPFPQSDEFSTLILEEGWGNSWGCIVRSAASFDECYRHFRRFLMVSTEEGQELYFRFYDPRVLKMFLPTCAPSQLIEFFGPVVEFLVEGDTREESIRICQRNGMLEQTKILPLARDTNSS